MAIWPRRAKDLSGDPAAYAALDDAVLAGLLAARDGRALEELYDRYSRLVFSLALRVLTQRERAEEVVQDVFVKLWREPRLYDPARGPFRPWLLRVAHHRAIDEVRRARHEVMPDPADDSESDFWQTLPDSGPLPEESAFAALDREAVLSALEALPAAQREAIELAYFAGLTQSEIAGRTGEPLGTVKTRVRLGIKRLRDLLGGPEAMVVR